MPNWMKLVFAAAITTAGFAYYYGPRADVPSDLRDAVADAGEEEEVTALALDSLKSGAESPEFEIPEPAAPQSQEPKAAPTGCNISPSQETALSKIGDVYKFRVASGSSYSTFAVDFRSEKWIGGLNACGGEGENPRERTYFRTDQSGEYVVYSARCGGRTSPFDGRVQVVFEKNGRSPVYVRSIVKVASFSLPLGIHSGPLKYSSDDVTCVMPGFDTSKVPALKKFDDIDGYLKGKSAESRTLGGLYREARQ